MRALTLTQPWAGLVAAGVKLVENRPRHMIKREDVGTRFAIHASRAIDAPTYNRIAQLAPDVLLFDEAGGPVIPCKRDWYRLSRVTSAVIAVATLDSIVDPLACGIDPDSDVARAALAPDQRRWFFGPIGYVLRDVRELAAPVPCRGYQAFWALPADVAARVEEQLR
jgi:hypothetical protein